MSTQDNNEGKQITVFLDGHEEHQGNVLTRAYISKLRKLLNVFARLERVYLDSQAKKTEFEIVGMEKYNPTTITLKPVPSAMRYNPIPAFDWGLGQLDNVGTEKPLDARIKSSLVREIAELSKVADDFSYKSFWINGTVEPIKFDEDYYMKALTLAKKMAEDEMPAKWYVGVSKGEVVGRLLKIDDLGADHECYIVPPIGAEKIRCKFPESMEDKIGAHFSKMVRVSGDIHYTELSPHPDHVVIKSGGIAPIEKAARNRPLRELRGLFAGAERNHVDIESLFGG